MPRALVAEDLVQCIKVGGAAVSHDGKCIAYVQRQWHLDSKQSTSDIFLLELPLTGGPGHGAGWWYARCWCAHGRRSAHDRAPTALGVR